MQCPLCTTEMTTTVELGVTLDLCPTCGAAWFDPHELATARGGDEALELGLRRTAHARSTCRKCGATIEEPAAPGATHCGLPVRLRCGRCQSMMAGASEQTMEIDVCQWCGSMFLPREAMDHLRELKAVAMPEPEVVPLVHPEALKESTSALPHLLAGILRLGRDER